MPTGLHDDPIFWGWCEVNLQPDHGALKQDEGGIPVLERCREPASIPPPSAGWRVKAIGFVVLPPVKMQTAGLESDPAVFIGKRNGSTGRSAALTL